MSEELKPCPFCGSAAREREQPGSFGGYGLTEISCHGCSATASDKDDWNRRHTAEIEARAIEQAVSATKTSFMEGGKKWLCHIIDLMDYANELRREANKMKENNHV